jgi:RecA/RadA recombinase
MKSIYDIVMKDKETKHSPALSSYLFTEDEPVEFLSTNVIALNLLYSGRFDGGIPIGRMSMISAPSMLGKSFIAYGLVKNAQKKGMQCVIVDTERAFSFQLAQDIGIDIDPKKLIVLQENGIEEVGGIIANLSKQIPKEERENVFVVVDSWGALVTSKTMENAETGNDKADMTIPKKKNNLANIMLNTRFTYFVVNHVYDNTGGMGDTLQVPGGRKIVFNCDSVILGRSAAKEKKSASNPEIIGKIVTAETYKSRFSKEKSKLKFRIKVDGGLDVFYGILDDALDGGFVDIPKMGYCSRMHIENDKPVKNTEIYNADFWLPIFKDTDFKEYLEKVYTYKSPLDITKGEEIFDDIHKKKKGKK